MSRRALIVRHVPREGLAGFRDTVEAFGYHLDRYNVPLEGEIDIDLLDPDLVILMGGPQSVCEPDRHDWLRSEIVMVRRRLDANLPTLGICLGAQIMAAALGARVARGTSPEVGFAPLSLTLAGERSPLGFLADVPGLHWHSDVFNLPPDCDRLAFSAATPNQAFRRGPNILALQFHAEMGEDPRIDDWIGESGECMAEAGVGVGSLRADYATLGPMAVAAGRKMIADWLEGFEHEKSSSVELADVVSRMCG